jgi:hypothetical protein
MMAKGGGGGNSTPSPTNGFQRLPYGLVTSVTLSSPSDILYQIAPP